MKEVFKYLVATFVFCSFVGFAILVSVYPEIVGIPVIVFLIVFIVCVMKIILFD